MTRINIGINPQELCDQMLVAEYRELPRIHDLATNRLIKYSNYGPRPNNFTLNKGHVSYLLPYGNTLMHRWSSICHEMNYREFSTNLQWRSYPWMLDIPDSELLSARCMLLLRIQNRLKLMKRTPKWTNRNSPQWTSHGL
jgi:hypothetical protein